MSNLTRYTMEHGKYAGIPYINEVPHLAGEWVKFDDIKELLQTSHNNARDEICAAWLPNEVACAFWGACNCAEVPCRNTRKLSPIA